MPRHAPTRLCVLRMRVGFSVEQVSTVSVFKLVSIEYQKRNVFLAAVKRENETNIS